MRTAMQTVSHVRARGFARLSPALIGGASTVATPRYDRAAASASIVHLGVGGFHRSHLAVYCDELLEARSGSQWGICGVGLLESDKAMREALVAQDGLYSVISKSAEGRDVRVVGSILEYLWAPAERETVLARLSGEEAKIISITVTEKGYGYDPVAQGLDATNEGVRHDLENPQAPLTAVGCVVEALRRRRAAGLGGLTVLSCDNLQENGHVVRRCVLDMAEAGREVGLRGWIEEQVTFPNSMVDRITPSTESADIDWLSQEHGIEDAWPVSCETFRQWVLEDNFCAGRPAWEDVGALFVPDVYPYELMKLRLLNTSHSVVAYPAYLLEHRTMDDAMADADVDEFAAGYMEEITPTIPAVPGVELAPYKKTLRERFGNPGIKDQVQRIAQDGSSKIANQMVPIIQENIAAGRSVLRSAALVGAYIQYMSGVDEQGAPISIQDPLLDVLQPLAREACAKGDASAFVAAAFGEDLSSQGAFMQPLQEFLVSFKKQGVRKTLQFLNKLP